MLVGLPTVHDQLFLYTAFDNRRFSSAFSPLYTTNDRSSFNRWPVIYSDKPFNLLFLRALDLFLYRFHDRLKPSLFYAADRINLF